MISSSVLLWTQTFLQDEQEIGNGAVYVIWKQEWYREEEHTGHFKDSGHYIRSLDRQFLLLSGLSSEYANGLRRKHWFTQWRKCSWYFTTNLCLLLSINIKKLCIHFIVLEFSADPYFLLVLNPLFQQLSTIVLNDSCRWWWSN